MEISIHKDFIKVENEIYYFNSIKNIEFKENKNSLGDKIGTTILENLFTSGIFIILIIPIFFIKNWVTIILAIIGIFLTFRNVIFNKPKYEIFIGMKRIYHTENKNLFESLKKQILER